MYQNDNFESPNERFDEPFLNQIFGDRVEENSYTKGCSCDLPAPRKTWGLEGYPVGMVYSPIQEWRALYDSEAGFERGTIFKELDLPYLGTLGAGSCGLCGGGRRD